MFQTPIGYTTSNEGMPVEIRDTITINSDLTLNPHFFDFQTHGNAERTTQRVAHPKGIAAFGYFEVTNDVSKYTKAKVFNGIGKKTPVLARFSVGTQERGGTDLSREFKGFAVKFYTEEGNLDFLGLHTPAFIYRDPLLFTSFGHAFRKSRAAGMLNDYTARWDFVCLNPVAVLPYLWILSDFGVADGYRRMDFFPFHTYYILNNEKGERYFVKFNFRTEHGLSYLSNDQIAAIQGTDLDYYNRGLYNAIAQKNYPSFRVEMDVLTEDEILNVGYNLLDVTVIWRNNTYRTVTIGRMVFNRNSDNQFRDAELSIFNPVNLVPGIPEPVDLVFKGRAFAYKDTQNKRLGPNHKRIPVNQPVYTNTYVRDGLPPVGDNMNDAPSYSPNSFNGPTPYVDDQRPREEIQVLDSNAVDLQQVADFYNYRIRDEGHKQRLSANVVRELDGVEATVLRRVLRLFYLIDEDLGHRVETGLLNRDGCTKN